MSCLQQGCCTGQGAHVVAGMDEKHAADSYSRGAYQSYGGCKNFAGSRTTVDFMMIKAISNTMPSVSTNHTTPTIICATQGVRIFFLTARSPPAVQVRLAVARVSARRVPIRF